MSIAEELQAAGSGGEENTLLSMQHGLTLAVVTNINDEEKLNRVKCLPIENENKEETDWCYVMAPLGGKQCGQFFFPNVNDVVVLGYLGGDSHRPVVLGACWTPQLPPPYTIENSQVYNFSIKTPAGTELLFYDEPDKQRVTLTLPSGTVLSIDDEKQAVALKDAKGENALEMDLKGGNVSLKAKTKLTLSAGDTTVELNASGTLTASAQNKASVEAATIEEKATTQVSVQGQVVEIKSGGTMTLQASGPNTIKGAMVSIN